MNPIIRRESMDKECKNCRWWVGEIEFSDEELNKIEIFHGGCHGCTQQLIEGKEFCGGCRYRTLVWGLPDLCNSNIAGTGICKRFPVPIKEKKNIMESRTEENDWCGEWEEKNNE